MQIEARTSVSYRQMSEEQGWLEREPTGLPIDVLEGHCQQEAQRFMQTGRSDGTYGFELCRRALELQSEAAWQVLMRVYGRLVGSWVRNHPSYVGSGEDETYFVNRAFERLWRGVACKAHKFDKFDSLGQILRFLKLCAHSAVMDDGLRRAPEAETPLETVETLLIGRAGVQIDTRNEFWQLVQQHLTSEAERVAIAGYFIYGMKNREIAATYPHLFDNAKQLSNLRVTVLRRLGRIPAFESRLRGLIDEGYQLGQRLVC